MDNAGDIRDRTIRKSNELIQQSRFNLTVQQQKIVLYLISSITPFDNEFQTINFDIPTFCRVCGIDEGNGKNYQDLKAAIKGVADKSVWITREDGAEVLLRWIEKPRIYPKSGTIELKLDDDMKPYLLQLKANYTEYEFIYVLHFRSRYTIRLYELIKSIHFHELESYSRKYTPDELRHILGADSESYTQYRNLKQRVLTPAIKEINDYSDKTVTFEEIKTGRFVTGVIFTIQTKPPEERMRIVAEIDEALGGRQLSLFDEGESSHE